VALILTALIARELGGDRKAMGIAAIAAAISPVSISSSALFQYVSFDFLWWVLLAWLVVKLVNTDDPRWWVPIGAVIGVATLTKYTIAFCIAGLAVGVLTSPLRRHLRSGWLWLGVAISIVIVAPHFLWQATNDFITLDFLKSIHERDVRIGRTDDFLVDQLFVAANAVTIPLWVIGIVALFRSQKFRVLAWMAVVPFILFVIARGRGYYAAPIYPTLIAAGTVEILRITQRKIVVAVIALLLLIGSGVALAILPLAPIDSPLGRFAIKSNGDLKEEVGWPEMTAEVARIWKSIPEAERAHTAIYCANYGEAGAINLYGPRYGLPQAISGVNSFWARGYGDPPPQTVIVLGSRVERLQGRFASVTLAGRIPNPFHLENEESERAEIYLCRGPRTPWPLLWPQIRSFG